jgi:hypothetical protein
VQTYRGPAHLAGLLDAYRVVTNARASRG